MQYNKRHRFVKFALRKKKFTSRTSNSQKTSGAKAYNLSVRLIRRGQRTPSRMQDFLSYFAKLYNKPLHKGAVYAILYAECGADSPVPHMRRINKAIPAGGVADPCT